MASFSSDDPTFKGLLASLRMAQGAQPSDDAVAGADAGPAAEHFGPAQAAVAQGSGEGGYTVPYELPPAVEGVFPTYASLEQARSGAVPTDPRSRSTSTDEYSPAASRSPAPPAPTGQENRGAQMAHRADPFATTSTGGRRKDLRLLSFTQALPYLSRLAEDPTFIALLRQLKADQDAFERRLSDERKQLIERHKAETEKARFKASVTGQGDLGEFQQRDLAAALATALATFHRKQVIPSWDYLANTQLDALEARGVPGLGVSKAERESDLGSNRLRKILGMLEGVLEDS